MCFLCSLFFLPDYIIKRIMSTDKVSTDVEKKRRTYTPPARFFSLCIEQQTNHNYKILRRIASDRIDLTITCRKFTMKECSICSIVGEFLAHYQVPFDYQVDKDLTPTEHQLWQTHYDYSKEGKKERESHTELVSLEFLYEKKTGKKAREKQARQGQTDCQDPIQDHS